MKIFLIVALSCCLLFITFQMMDKKNIVENNAYNFSFKRINNEQLFTLQEFKGKVILIVNTASKCGFTPQYKDLEEVYQKYKDKGLVIIGVPSEDFGGQELEDNEKVEQFCKINYGVTFPLTTKEHVVGSHAHPFYVWAKKILGVMGTPKWNFHKYVIDKNGKLVDYFYSTTNLTSKKCIRKIEELLSVENN